MSYCLTDQSKTGWLETLIVSYEWVGWAELGAFSDPIAGVTHAAAFSWEFGCNEASKITLHCPGFLLVLSLVFSPWFL